MSRNQFWIYCDSSLVFISPLITYFPNPAGLFFGITDIRHICIDIYNMHACKLFVTCMSDRQADRESCEET